MKLYSYKLSSEQVYALFSLLMQINLLRLKNTGEILSYGRGISDEQGKIIEQMFYDEKFGIVISNE